MDANSYWPALEDPAEFGGKLKTVVEGNAKSATLAKVKAEQGRAYLQVYAIGLNGDSSASRIMRDGQEGELATFRIPMARALGNAILNITTSSKLAWQCTAANADAAARAQTILGQNALEYYWFDRGIGQAMKDLAEKAIYFGECFAFLEFDPSAGEIAGVSTLPPAPGETTQTPSPLPGETTQTPAPVFSGDAKLRIVASWDVCRDPSAESYEECDWYAVRLSRNKFDLAARYGIEVLDACGERRGILADATPHVDKTQTDLVDCWYFFHKKTPALPMGRQAVVIGDKAFELSELKYREVPLVRLATGNLIGTSYAFAPFWCALAAQELQDSLLSSLATNNLAFGTQIISAEMGTEIEPDNFGPMRLMLTPPGAREPKGINFTASSPETYKLLDMVESRQKQVLGLNNTALGTPEGSNLSGAAMALLSSMAIQANSRFQDDYARAVELVGTILLHIFQDFFTAEHKIRISGKNTSYMAREQSFTGDDLKAINAVSVRIGNPMSQTSAGREQIVDKYIMVQKDIGVQMIRTPEDLQQLMETGRIEGLTSDLRDQALLVQSENESLARGEPVVALLGDDDIYHCRHHRSVVTSIEARQDDTILNNALDHIHEHYRNYFGTEPAGTPDPMTGMMIPGDPPEIYRQNMLVLFGLQAPMPPMSPGGPMPPGAQPPADSGPAPGGLPSMPTNPQTGQEFDPATGGGVAPPPGA